MELIDRQAAIDLFPDDALEWDTNGGYIAPHFARQMIEELPSAQPDPQWIPCSERLPDKNQICIVTDDKRDITYEYGFHPETYDEVNGWTYLGHKIIAWMPLPEPWRG